MWSPSLVRLDLSRRRVAAISFLANIPTENEPNDIHLDCLKVIKDFDSSAGNLVIIFNIDYIVMI